MLEKNIGVFFYKCETRVSFFVESFIIFWKAGKEKLGKVDQEI